MSTEANKNDGNTTSTGAVLVYKMSDKGPPVVRRALDNNGWLALDEIGGDVDWNICWKSGRFKPSDYAKSGKHQRLNHFPKTNSITKKDSLLRNLRKMKGIYGNIFNFFPLTFVLPHEYTKFVNSYSEQEEKDIWICKPADMSRGRKIFLIRDLGDLHYDQQYVVQKYVSNPMLIADFKWDLRIYVLVTSFHPLTVYLYKDGLVRFGTQKYDTSTLTNMFSHLTNSSVNKNSPTFHTEKDTIGAGCKWTYEQLRQYFATHGVDDSNLWGRITNICILTLAMIANIIPETHCCFELFGFDVLVDVNMKPWLLEVNCSPALGNDCPADDAVKTPLIRDMLKVLDFDGILKQCHDEEVERQMKLKQSKQMWRSLSAGALGSGGKSRMASTSGSAASTRYSDSPRYNSDKDHGNFELVFPFNERTEEAARFLAGMSTRNKEIKTVQDALRVVVQDVKVSEAQLATEERARRRDPSAIATKRETKDKDKILMSIYTSIQEKDKERDRDRQDGSNTDRASTASGTRAHGEPADKGASTSSSTHNSRTTSQESRRTKSRTSTSESFGNIPGGRPTVTRLSRSHSWSSSISGSTISSTRFSNGYTAATKAVGSGGVSQKKTQKALPLPPRHSMNGR
eukprot:GFYU01004969.1.p1 GENE.GFYU01004969.1~~GFYU01004969.1.p1  ORF type:complete len:628 (-),score=83.50 GFYU01004969.1:675-2558(-)